MFPCPSDSIEIFVSYAREDGLLRDELAKHLSQLKHEGLIKEWSDRQIVPGTNRQSEIDKKLNTADIILLLVSADFMVSDYCYSIEMKRAMQRYQAGEARVIPILLREVDWSGAPFSNLQVLPTGACPVTQWPTPDAAFTDIAKGIRKVVEELRREPVAAPSEARAVMEPRESSPLWYVLDRYEQEKSLLRAVSEHVRDRRHRPLVCILHGHNYEMPDAFLERIMEDSLLGKISRLWYPPPGRRVPTPLRIGMKLSLEIIESEDSEQRNVVFKEDLALAFANDPLVSPGEFIRMHADQDFAFIVTATLSYEQLERVGLSVLDDFIRFWGTLPDLLNDQLVIVCLSFTYFGEAGRRLLRLWRPQGVEGKLRRYVSKIQSRKDRSREALLCFPTPEMLPISKDDALRALDHEAVKERYYVERLNDDLTELYGMRDWRASQHRIPFKTLQDEFNKRRR
jgi:hypothetical protein